MTRKNPSAYQVNVSIRRARNRVLLFLLAFHISSISQTINDTLNQYNNKNKKNGRWVFYLDARFNRCEKEWAKYYGYEYYIHGKSRDEAVGRTHSRDSMEYVQNPNSASQTELNLLNGELRTYTQHNNKQRIKLSETFVDGKLSVLRENSWSSQDSTGESTVLYFDSLYRNTPHTFLLHETDKNIVLYRQYSGQGRPLTEREYFVKAREFRFKYRPIVGYFGCANKPSDQNLKAKSFLELGFSKKYIKGVAIDTTGKTYFDNLLAFPALNISLLGSYTNKEFCLGQKVSYSFCAAFLKAEAGAINYTNFKQYDLRLMLGVGFEIPFLFTYMVYFSRSVGGTQFADIDRVTFTVAID